MTKQEIAAMLRRFPRVGMLPSAVTVPFEDMKRLLAQGDDAADYVEVLATDYEDSCDECGEHSAAVVKHIAMQLRAKFGAK